MTFRVEEEEEEVEEELQAIVEAPTNPRIGEGGGTDMMKIIQHGMHHSHQGEEIKIVMASGELTMEIIVRITPKKSLRIETLMATQPMSMIPGKMRKEKGLGAQVLEGKDIAEGTEV